MQSPRPILKRPAALGCTSTTSHLAVHFPPSPSLTTHTFTAYSSAAYDRSPIEVSPNSCALPERGCPGRTYTLDEPRARYHRSRGIHPRAMQDDAARAIPALIPDLSSESDESDAFSSPPTESSSPSSHLLGLVIPTDRFQSSDSYISPTALAFLPHSHSAYPDDDEQPSPSQPSPSKPRRRRERKHDPSRTPVRIPDPRDCPTIRTPTKKRVPALQPSSFHIEDDGCLGGF